MSRRKFRTTWRLKYVRQFQGENSGQPEVFRYHRQHQGKDLKQPGDFRYDQPGNKLCFFVDLTHVVFAQQCEIIIALCHNLCFYFGWNLLHIFSLCSLISGFSVLGYVRIHCIVLWVCDMFVPGSLFSSTSTTPFPSSLRSRLSSFLSFDIFRML